MQTGPVNHTQGVPTRVCIGRGVSAKDQIVFHNVVDFLIYYVYFGIGKQHKCLCPIDLQPDTSKNLTPCQRFVLLFH